MRPRTPVAHRRGQARRLALLYCVAVVVATFTGGHVEVLAPVVWIVTPAVWALASLVRAERDYAIAHLREGRRYGSTEHNLETCDLSFEAAPIGELVDDARGEGFTDFLLRCDGARVGERLPLREASIRIFPALLRVAVFFGLDALTRVAIRRVVARLIRFERVRVPVEFPDDRLQAAREV